MTRQEQIYRQLAKTLSLHPELVERVVKSQFDYVARIMEEGSFSPVRLQYLGTFDVKKNRLKHLNKHKQISND